MSLHLKKDGTPDMRYKCNREAAGLSSSRGGGQVSSSSGGFEYEQRRSPVKSEMPPFVFSPEEVYGFPRGSQNSTFSSPEASEDEDYTAHHNYAGLGMNSTDLILHNAQKAKPSSPKSSRKNVEEPKNRKFDSTDFRYTQDGKISMSSRAVKSGEILLKSDGTVDRRCSAVRRENLVLNDKGMPDQTVHNVEIPKNPGEYSTSVYRDKNSQKKFRKENNLPNDHDASHIIDLEVAKAILAKKPGPHLSEKDLREAVKPINSLLESRPVSVNRANSGNPDNDHDMAQRIIKLVKGEKTPITRALTNKLEQMSSAIKTIPTDKRNGSIDFIEKTINQLIKEIKVT